MLSNFWPMHWLDLTWLFCQLLTSLQTISAPPAVAPPVGHPPRCPWPWGCFHRSDRPERQEPLCHDHGWGLVEHGHPSQNGNPYGNIHPLTKCCPWHFISIHVYIIYIPHAKIVLPHPWHWILCRPAQENDLTFGTFHTNLTPSKRVVTAKIYKNIRPGCQVGCSSVASFLKPQAATSHRMDWKVPRPAAAELPSCQSDWVAAPQWFLNCLRCPQRRKLERYDCRKSISLKCRSVFYLCLCMI